MNRSVILMYGSTRTSIVIIQQQYNLQTNINLKSITHVYTAYNIYYLFVLMLLDLIHRKKI